jgi:hypothetical protein
VRSCGQRLDWFECSLIYHGFYDDRYIVIVRYGWPHRKYQVWPILRISTAWHFHVMPREMTGEV